MLLMHEAWSYLSISEGTNQRTSPITAGTHSFDILLVARMACEATVLS